MQSLDQFLSRPRERPRKCGTCAHEEVRAAIAEFKKRTEDGSVSLSWMYFYEEYLVKELRYQLTYAAMMDHVRRCL